MREIIPYKRNWLFLFSLIPKNSFILSYKSEKDFVRLALKKRCNIFPLSMFLDIAVYDILEHIYIEIL